MDDAKDLTFQDMLIYGSCMIHVDENGNQERIEPYSEKWYKIIESPNYNNRVNVDDYISTFKLSDNELNSILKPFFNIKKPRIFKNGKTKI